MLSNGCFPACHLGLKLNVPTINKQIQHDSNPNLFVYYLIKKSHSALFRFLNVYSIFCCGYSLIARANVSYGDNQMLLREVLSGTR